MPGWVGHRGVEQDVGNVGAHLSIRGGFARNDSLLHTLMISPVPKDVCSCSCPTLMLWLPARRRNPLWLPLGCLESLLLSKGFGGTGASRCGELLQKVECSVGSQACLSLDMLSHSALPPT